MQSFLSKLKLALGYINSVKTAFRLASASTIKSDHGILSQFLQNNQFTIKLMAEDNWNVFRLFCDAESFTESSYTDLINKYSVCLKTLLQNCKPLIELFTLLNQSIDYAERVLTQLSSKEVDIVLVSLFLDYSIRIYFIGETSMEYSDLIFPDTAKKIYIYLDHYLNCHLLYPQEFITCSGFCQVIVQRIIDNAVNEHNGKPLMKFDDIATQPCYYVNYEYLLWKNKPIEEAATPILGYHRNAIKPIKSFKEMLLEKYSIGNAPNNQYSKESNNLNVPQQAFTPGPSPSFQHKKFDINALISPLVTPYPLYMKTKAFHSNPQSPLIPPPIKPDTQMEFPEPTNLQATNMKLHPGYSQFKKEIFETSAPEFTQPQFQEYFPKSTIPIQPQTVEYRAPSFNLPVVPQNSLERFSGRLKFFDELQNFGFFIMDLDGSDLFVHYEDLKKAGLTKEYLKMAKGSSCMRFTFNCVSYYGKYSLSRKAINIEYYYETEPKHGYGFMQ